jgi:thymidylate synthase
MTSEREVKSTLDFEESLYRQTERILDSVDPDKEQLRYETNPFDFEYHRIVRRVLAEGAYSGDRTGTGTIKIPGASLEFVDIDRKFPLLGSKFTWFEGVKGEMGWFIKGGRNIRPLVLQGVNIWNEWAFEWYLKQKDLRDTYPTYSKTWRKALGRFVKRIKNEEEFAEVWGDIGPVYGFQWRNWESPNGEVIDQLQEAIDTLSDPNKRNSRRIIVSAWNVAHIKELAERSLPPCHTMFQFIVTYERNTREPSLNCVMFQRSCDVFLGLPFNIASYALLTHMVGDLVGIKPGNLTVHLSDTHIYTNHLEQVEKQLSNPSHRPPSLKINTGDKKILRIEDYQLDDFTIVDYEHSGRIPAPISV